MSADDRPPLQPIGPTWKAVRLELPGNVRQVDVGILLGFDKSAQSAMSNREKHPDDPAATEPSNAELVRFEDHYGLQRGTVLRRAGYVVDSLDPIEMVDSWSFLDPTEKRIVRGLVADAWERAGRPGGRPSLTRGNGRVVPEVDRRLLAHGAVQMPDDALSAVQDFGDVDHG